MCNDLMTNTSSHWFSFNLCSEYYIVQSMSQDVAVNPDGVSPSVELLVALNLKVYFRIQNFTGISYRLFNASNN